jgi:hypothetical protein
MKTILSWRRRHYLIRVSISLILVFLIGGMAGCGSTSTPAPQYDLTIGSTAGGSVTAPGEAGPYTCHEGEVVDLVATRDAGYRFVNWTGDVDTIADVSAAETSITINGDYSITANFAPDTIEIRNWYHLEAIRGDLSGSYLLMVDLDQDTPGYQKLASETANQGKGWEPIGTPDEPFTGAFDGQTHEIRDFSVKRSDQDWVGLFGCVGEGGIIENLGLGNVTVAGNFCVGGLAGQVYYGTVKGCHSAGSVTGDSCAGGLVGLNGKGGAMENTYSACCVSGNLTVGGLVGDNYFATVSNSSSSGSVSGEDRVGGLAGDNICSTVSCSYSTGTVSGGVRVGGLAGYNHILSIVINCYSSGSVGGDHFTGGLIGYDAGGLIANCYSVGGATGEDSVGGLVGFSDSGDATTSFWDIETSGCAESDGGTAKTTSEMRAILTFSRLSWNIVTVGRHETNEAYIWNIVDGETYPFLSWEP